MKMRLPVMFFVLLAASLLISACSSVVTMQGSLGGETEFGIVEGFFYRAYNPWDDVTMMTPKDSRIDETSLNLYIFQNRNEPVYVLGKVYWPRSGALKGIKFLNDKMFRFSLFDSEEDTYNQISSATVIFFDYDTLRKFKAYLESSQAIMMRLEAAEEYVLLDVTAPMVYYWLKTIDFYERHRETGIR